MVQDDLNLNASILCVGEAPGAVEEKMGRVFAGPSGRVLEAWLAHAGLQRRDLYITNFLTHMPPTKGGDITQAIKESLISQEEIEQNCMRIHALIAAMPNLRVIVPIGNYATWCISKGQRGKTVMTPKNQGISEVRGGVYSYDYAEQS